MRQALRSSQRVGDGFRDLLRSIEESGIILDKDNEQRVCPAIGASSDVVIRIVKHGRYKQ